MTDESKLWATARTKLPGYWIRVEDSLSSGFPDCVGTINNRTLCLELKRQSMWGRVHDLQMSTYQAAWHSVWRSKGGESYILAQVASDVFLLDPALMDRDYIGDDEWFRLLAVAWSWPAIAIYLLK